MKTVAFFNNKGGVGKTSMVYHLAWMFQDMGLSVLAADLDPQSNLTSAFLDDADLERLWPDGKHPNTIYGAAEPLVESLGDVKELKPVGITAQLHLIAGDLNLSVFEDRLSQAWVNCSTDNPATAGDGFRVVTAFHRVVRAAAERSSSQIVLIDVGPNIGAMNRAALVAADFVVIPIGADLFSLQGLRNLGPTLRNWRTEWATRKGRKVPQGLSIPGGQMKPLGYVLLNPSVQGNRPVKSYLKWANRIPAVYARDVLGTHGTTPAGVETDVHQLALLKHFKSLMPMAQDARKPMFHLTAKDGAIGGHSAAVADCRMQFVKLAQRIQSEMESIATL